MDIVTSNNTTDIFKNWQVLVDLMAEIIGVPAGLIMRIKGSDIEVFVSSKSQGNPYRRGDKEHLLEIQKRVNENEEYLKMTKGEGKK